MVEGQSVVLPAGLPSKFLKDECFEELAEQGAVAGQCRTVHAEKRRSDAGVAEDGASASGAPSYVTGFALYLSNHAFR